MSGGERRDRLLEHNVLKRHRGHCSILALILQQRKKDIEFSVVLSLERAKSDFTNKTQILESPLTVLLLNLNKDLYRNKE